MVPTYSYSAHDGVVAGAYLFESIDESFEKSLARRLRDVSYTLVLDRASRSARLYLHSPGRVDALAQDPRSAFNQLTVAAERGDDIDLLLAHCVMHSDEPQVRLGLAELLSEVGIPTATPLLAELLLDGSRPVALAAVDALVEQDTHEAVYVLGAALLDGQMSQRYEVAEGLSEFETDLARSYLAQVRGDADPRVRGLVDEVLSDPN